MRVISYEGKKYKNFYMLGMVSLEIDPDKGFNVTKRANYRYSMNLYIENESILNVTYIKIS